MDCSHQGSASQGLDQRLEQRDGVGLDAATDPRSVDLTADEPCLRTFIVDIR